MSLCTPLDLSQKLESVFKCSLRIYSENYFIHFQTENFLYSEFFKGCLQFSDNNNIVTGESFYS